jgi:aminoglycoside 6'-N-acetyltransferase I
LDRVAAEVFDGAVVEPSLSRFLDDGRHILAVAIDEGVVVGMATGAEIFQPDKAPQLFINEVGVAPTHHRRGVARRLMDMLLDEAKRRGCDGAWVGTEPDNAAANALYRSIPRGEPAETFVLYEWKIGG